MRRFLLWLFQIPLFWLCMLYLLISEIGEKFTRRLMRWYGYR